MNALRVAAKDALVEARTRELLDAVLLGALAVAVAAGIAFAALPDSAERTAAVLWIGTATAALVPLARSFTGEADRGTLEVLLALPVDRGALLLGKALGNLALTLAGSLAVLATYATLFGASVSGAGVLAVLVLGAAGLSLAGSLLAAIAAQARSREALLPVLLFPLLLPVLLAAIPASVQALRGAPLAAFGGPLALLAGYALLLAAAGWLLFEHVVEG